ncbi:hypothetical protein AB0442_36220 [Kitasatospora sp. NPDC085895]|uniref:hypothetical protein n=1 Tax=Kitasatospora sp. NPDC085895 TaxID=3155057 RepID=UPI00344FBE62
MFRRTPARPAAPVRARSAVRPACADLGLLPSSFSPLIGALLESYCHTRTAAALVRGQLEPEEYRAVAGAIVRDLLEGWAVQSGGRGTVEDLLAAPAPVLPVPRTPAGAPPGPVAGGGR